MPGRIAVVAFLTTSLFFRIAAAQSQTPMEFMEAIIDSLAVTADGHSLITKPTTVEVEDLMNTRLATTKLNDAQRRMAPFLGSDDTTIRQIAETFAQVYGRLVQELNRSVALSENMIRLKAQLSDGKATNAKAQVAALSIEASKIRAALDVTWRLVAQVTTESSHVLVDADRAQDGKLLPYLRITSQERVSLRAKLKRLFDGDLNETARSGQHAIQVAPRLLWRFLNDADWKTADMP
jgi:hypothetical protein